jgi:hypothetical protein
VALVLAEYVRFLLLSAARQRRPTHVAKGFDVAKRWLLNVVRRVITSPLSFPDDSGVRYFDQVWLRKATDIVEGKRGNTN